MKNYLKIAVGIILLIITIIACRREIFPKSDSFNAGSAKEWWYGTFRKSAEYGARNWQSVFAPPRTKSSKKYPDWKKAVAYKKNNVEIVELPLYYVTNNILLPGMQSLNGTREGERIARSSTHKLLLMKKSDGTTLVRTVTIVPSPEYARKNSYDISRVSPNNLPPDFDGYLMIARWDETAINTVKIKGGKPVKRIKLLTKEQASKLTIEANRTEEIICPPPIWVPDMVWVCAIVPTGDEVADQEHCEEIGNWADQGSYELPECYDTGGGEDPLDECLLIGGTEDCYCLLWGIGCGSDDQGGSGNSNAVNTVINNLTDPCKNAALSAITAPAINNAITSFYNTSLQPINSPISLIIGEGNVPGGGPAISGEIVPGTNIWSTTLNNTFLYSGNSMSQEVWGAIIAHEILHIFISSSNLAPYMTNSSHHLVMFNSFITTISNLLQTAFGIAPADATKLALNGLDDLWTWGNFDSMSQSQYGYTRAQFQSTYQQYTVGGGGTRCQ